MKKANIAELKNGLSRYLAHVRNGGTVVVFDRDQPVAHIVPVSARRLTSRSTDDRMRRLERRGLIRRGKGGRPEWLGRRAPPQLRGSVLKDLLAERGRGW